MKLRLRPFSILKPSFWDHFEWLGEVGRIVSCTPRLHTDGGLEKKNESSVMFQAQLVEIKRVNWSPYPFRKIITAHFGPSLWNNP